jgi:hypothetical protein
MPRIARRAPKEWAFMRSVARLPLFQKNADNEAFECVVEEFTWDLQSRFSSAASPNPGQTMTRVRFFFVERASLLK